jgi:hypothetical protein
MQVMKVHQIVKILMNVSEMYVVQIHIVLIAKEALNVFVTKDFSIMMVLVKILMNVQLKVFVVLELLIFALIMLVHSNAHVMKEVLEHHLIANLLVNVMIIKIN